MALLLSKAVSWAWGLFSYDEQGWKTVDTRLLFPSNDVSPPSLSQMHSTRWCGRRIAQVPPWFPRRTKSRSSLGLWWCCITHLWGVTFREEGVQEEIYVRRDSFLHWLPQDLCWKFQLHLNPFLDLRKASTSKCSANCLQAKTPETSFTKFISVHASESTCLSGKSASPDLLLGFGQITLKLNALSQDGITH